jgi:hypothetical protein
MFQLQHRASISKNACAPGLKSVMLSISGDELDFKSNAHSCWRLKVDKQGIIIAAVDNFHGYNGVVSAKIVDMNPENINSHFAAGNAKTIASQEQKGKQLLMLNDFSPQINN